MKPLAALICTLILAGCGFQLRGSATLPFETLYVQAPVGSQFGAQLRRLVTAGSNTRIVDVAQGADATLVLVHELREKNILSLSGGGRVREYQLRYRMAYRLLDKNAVEILPASEIILIRDLSYSDSDTLSKEAEEALLFRDMQSDAVQQLLRRLQLTKLTPANA
jgi:LPS-assembly lipoprotein